MAQLKLRLQFATMRLGYGKAELLEHIAATGSIAAAGRRMEMSYKRAWMLVEEMNAAFAEPVVARVRGGQGGGGAQLTATGAQVLRLYREIVWQAEQAAATPLAALEALLRPQSDMSDEK